ncbi:MerR family transcriptional regulator [Kineococcus sp. SYSU DK005]|uniref:MerR family transcriptional regulator n=1 Tax=Kineococcus sp. SYSU DK005 TaxID=3383126 RepID=UPI003D7CDE10
MFSPFVPPRQVKIGDAAAFVGTTARAIRHYHEIGLLPEPPRGGDDRRRYGYDEVVQLLWIRKMADAGIALDDIRDAFAGAVGAGADDDHDVARVLRRLEETLTAREAELRRQRSAVQRMRTRGTRTGLLCDVVGSRLQDLPEGCLRHADLDTLLVTERVLGPLAAAVQATRFTALATHPDLREESDRVEAAEAALDDTVAVDDPRVAQVAARRHAFETALHAVIEDSGLAQDDEALLDSWDALHPTTADGADPHGGGAEGGDAEGGDAEGGDAEGGDPERGGGRAGRRPGRGREPVSALEAAGKVPYDFSPARLRCVELAEELAARG